MDNPAEIDIDLWIASGNEDKTQDHNPEDSKANAIAKTAAKLKHPGTRPPNGRLFSAFPLP